MPGGQRGELSRATGAGLVGSTLVWHRHGCQCIPGGAANGCTGTAWWWSAPLELLLIPARPVRLLPLPTGARAADQGRGRGLVEGAV